MKQEKFTQGKWEADGNRVIIKNENKPNKIICEGSNPYDNETLANARLIAKAPEMLEALKRCEGIFGALADIGRHPIALLREKYGDQYGQGWMFLTKVINQVEGKE